MIINISNHPVKPEITRKVEYGGLIESAEDWYGSPKQVTIAFKVLYFLNGESLFEGSVNHIAYLRATEDTYVDAQGNVVPQEEGVMSEYDFFQLIKSNPVTINDLIEAKAVQGDLQGRFDFDI